MIMLIVTFTLLISRIVCDKPNIVFVLVDDVGWADFNYSTGGQGSIPTPNLDTLSASGVRLRSHYVHPTCTPSRAALMTGRYAYNTGLPFAMFPGSVAGLPADMPTLPQLLRQAGYSAHMVGKWHVGHSQWAQTPVGRGFQTHVGSFMWDLESYTKQMWRGPGWVVGRDWGRYHENRSYEHFAEDRHATVAITEEANERMREHVKGPEKDNSLFLYVSYNAAHAPLQPEPEWEEECLHIPHLWRRQFCGMVVGLDQSIAKIVETARSVLGDNTVIVVSSDNGGSPWFGGLNYPLRSGKLTPFEGGVRVPAFLIDISGKYSKQGDLKRIMHISDWLPTFLSWANASNLVDNLDLDGLDQSEALMTGKLIRRDVVLEMFTANDSHDGLESVAYRNGPFKIVQGHFRDPNWYSEPKDDKVATSDESWLPRVLEIVVRIVESLFGNGPTNIMPHELFFNAILFDYYINKQSGVKTWLFDVEKDPEETKDIGRDNPKLLRGMFLALQEIKYRRPVHIHKYWMINPDWQDPSHGSFVAGNCSMQTPGIWDKCLFAHPWLEDDVDLLDVASLGLEDEFKRTSKILFMYLLGSILMILSLLVSSWKFLSWAFMRSAFKEKQN